MVVNLDMAVAGQSATLGFPEAKRGVTVGAGGIPRLVRLVGHTRGRFAPYTSWPEPCHIESLTALPGFSNTQQLSCYLPDETYLRKKLFNLDSSML